MTETAGSLSARYRLVLIASVLVAFALRAHRLAAQSLWSDEDITLDRVGRPLAELLSSLPIEHAPAYFVLTRVWTQLVGDGDLALRAPSLFFGALSVPLAGYVGRRLLGPRAGAMAAVLAAVNPFLVWYGQEARMYAMLAALALAALACALRALGGAARPWWVATGALAALTVYTHYYGALVVAVLATWAVHDAMRRGLRSVGGWMLAAVVAGAVFTPWLGRAAGVLAFPGWREPVPLSRAPWMNLSAWSAGGTASPAEATWIAAAYCVLAILGTVAVATRALRGPRRHQAQRAVLYVATPLVVAAAMVARQPDFHPRYFLAVVPAFYLLVSAGVAWLPSPAAVASGAVLVLAAVPPLANLYGDPAHQKQDYRAVIATVEASSPDADVALLLDGPPFGMMERYRSEGTSVKIVNLQSTAFRDLADARLFDEIEGRVRPYRTVWIAEDGAATGAARRWLRASRRPAYPVADLSVQDVRLSRFLLDDGSAVSRPARAEPMSGDLPVDLEVGAPHAAVAGAPIPLDLYWGLPAGADPRRDGWKVSLRLVDDAGGIVASVDRAVGDPGPGRADRHGLLVPNGVPPGAYALEVVLYEASTLRELRAWRRQVPFEVRAAAEPRP